MGKHSEYAIVEESVKLGSGTAVWDFTKIFGDVEIGRDCVIGNCCVIKGNKGGLVIGDRVRIQDLVFIDGPGYIGDDCFIAPLVFMGNGRHPPGGFLQGPRIGKNVVIGGGACIMPGVVVGDYAVIAMGSRINRDVEPGTVVGDFGRRIMSRLEFDKRKKEWRPE